MSQRSPLSARTRSNRQSGFTLIEVLVAIVLLGIVTTASLYFSLQAMKSSSDQQRRQVAVTIANRIMETVAATNPALNPGTGVSGLYTGRLKSDVQAAWTAYATTGGVASTYATWDPTATSSSVPTLPVTSPATIAQGTTYTTVTLIGVCYRPLNSATGTDCGLAAGYPTTPPAVAPAGMVAQARAMVIVTWTAGTQVCASGSCAYQTSTLIDTNSDLQWVLNG